MMPMLYLRDFQGLPYISYLESDDGVVEVEGEEGLSQLAEERLQDDGGDVHVAVLEHDLLALVDFALK